MLNKVFNYRVLFLLLFCLIAVGTIIFTTVIAKKIAKDELQKVTHYVNAQKALTELESANFPLEIIKATDDVPIIVTTDKDSVIESRNIDTTNNSTINWKEKLNILKNENPKPIKIQLFDSSNNYVYYGHTKLYKQIKYFPYIQVFIVALFIWLVISTLQTQYKSTQNQIWAGMAKETAHQLGTPISSLQAWTALGADDGNLQQYLPEIQKDIERLKLVSDRFGKIGSQPKLLEKNIYVHILHIAEYMQKRASGKVQIIVEANEKESNALISPELFDWVMENLIKNALDAMEGKGQITINITNAVSQNKIEVSDTGKGIEKKYWKQVFKPGFSTKKRGWGLGLTLCKRIVEQYHNGAIYIKNSVIGQGTTFCIELNK
jgi:two-component sensor histidine kinase